MNIKSIKILSEEEQVGLFLSGSAAILRPFQRMPAIFWVIWSVRMSTKSQV